jgi:putative hydrolase of the HAD superfamily
MVNSRYQYLIMDLDETLYPRRAGLMDEISRRIPLYMVQRMGFAPEKADALRKRLFVQYGTSLRGLQLEYHIDADDHLHFVHDVPVEEYLAPDPALDAMLGRIRLKKAIFTNADTAHARCVVSAGRQAGDFELVKQLVGALDAHIASAREAMD